MMYNNNDNEFNEKKDIWDRMDDEWYRRIGLGPPLKAGVR